LDVTGSNPISSNNFLNSTLKKELILFVLTEFEIDYFGVVQVIEDGDWFILQIMSERITNKHVVEIYVEIFSLKYFVVFCNTGLCLIIVRFPDLFTNFFLD